MSLTDFAWAAGFLDGEGYISVSKKRATYGIQASGTRVGRPRSCGVVYHLVILAVQINPAPIERLVKLFGGAMTKCHRSGRGKSDYWRWRIGGDPAVTALEFMAPFFVGKAQLASLALSFGRWYSATKGENGRSMSSERRVLAEQYFLECRRLIALHRCVPTTQTTAEGRVIGWPANAEADLPATGSGGL